MYYNVTAYCTYRYDWRFSRFPAAASKRLDRTHR